MKNAKKVIALLLCAVLLVAGSIAGTMAYLTSTPGKVENTFTAGKVEITLDEAPVDVYGETVTGNRVTANEYKLIPGHTYTKDPTVHVAKGSEECWLFVKVENGLAAIEADATIASQIANNGWTALENGGNIYWKKINALDATADVDVVVFESFTLEDDADVSEYIDEVITINAYAIQADGFGTAAAAWAAAPASWN